MQSSYFSFHSGKFKTIDCAYHARRESDSTRIEVIYPNAGLDLMHNGMQFRALVDKRERDGKLSDEWSIERIALPGVANLGTFTVGVSRPSIKVAFSVSEDGQLFEPSIDLVFASTSSATEISSGGISRPHSISNEEAIFAHLWEVARKLHAHRIERRHGAYLDERRQLYADKEGFVKEYESTGRLQVECIKQELDIASNSLISRRLTEREITFLRTNQNGRVSNKQSEYKAIFKDLFSEEYRADADSSLIRITSQTPTLSTRSTGNFWLGGADIGYFTSPRRRFSDLLNQQQLSGFLQGNHPSWDRSALGEHLKLLKKGRNADSTSADEHLSVRAHLMRSILGRPESRFITDSQSSSVTLLTRSNTLRDYFDALASMPQRSASIEQFEEAQEIICLSISKISSKSIRSWVSNQLECSTKAAYDLLLRARELGVLSKFEVADEAVSAAQPSARAAHLVLETASALVNTAFCTRGANSHESVRNACRLACDLLFDLPEATASTEAAREPTSAVRRPETDEPTLIELRDLCASMGYRAKYSWFDRNDQVLCRGKILGPDNRVVFTTESPLFRRKLPAQLHVCRALLDRIGAIKRVEHLTDSRAAESESSDRRILKAAREIWSTELEFLKTRPATRPITSRLAFLGQLLDRSAPLRRVTSSSRTLDGERAKAELERVCHYLDPSTRADALIKALSKCRTVVVALDRPISVDTHLEYVAKKFGLDATDFLTELRNEKLVLVDDAAELTLTRGAKRKIWGELQRTPDGVPLTVLRGLFPGNDTTSNQLVSEERLAMVTRSYAADPDDILRLLRRMAFVSCSNETNSWFITRRGLQLIRGRGAPAQPQNPSRSDNSGGRTGSAATRAGSASLGDFLSPDARAALLSRFGLSE